MASAATTGLAIHRNHVGQLKKLTTDPALKGGSELSRVYLAQKPSDVIVPRNHVKKMKLLLQLVLLSLGLKLNFNQLVSTNQQAANNNLKGLSQVMLNFAALAGITKQKEGLIEALGSRGSLNRWPQITRRRRANRFSCDCPD